MANAYLYVVFSKTPYKMGRAIRMITGEAYNHVSISLNKTLEPMYSFARRFRRTPFYGGFVQESISRYHINGKASEICLCCVEITQDRYDHIAERLADMTEHQLKYLYNHFSAIMAPLHRSVKLRDSYLCVEFVVDILHSAGFEINTQRYYTIGDLQQLLQPYVIYTGEIQEAEEYDSTYFADRPVRHPALKSLGAFFALFRRLHI